MILGKKYWLTIMFIIGTLTSCVTLGKYRDMESLYYKCSNNLNGTKNKLNNLTEQYNNLVSNHNKNIEKYNKLTNSYNDIESKYKNVVDKNKKNEAHIYRLNKEKDSLSRECSVSDIEKKIPVGHKKNDSTYVCIITSNEYSEENEYESISDMLITYTYQYNYISDAELFKKYCENVLNINHNHIFLEKNAKYNDLKSCLLSVRDSSIKYNGEINIIFFIIGVEAGRENFYKYTNYTYEGFHSSNYNEEKWAKFANDTSLWIKDKEGNKICYNLSNFYNELQEINAKQIVCFMDIKRASIIREDVFPDIPNTRVNDLILESAYVKLNSSEKHPPRTIYIKPKEEDTLQDIKSNVVVFLSSKEKETSYEMPYEEHGMFAYYLMKKIKQSKGNITLGNLYEYISVNVKQSAEDFLGTDQTPTVVTYPDKNYNWKSLKLCN